MVKQGRFSCERTNLQEGAGAVSRPGAGAGDGAEAGAAAEPGAGAGAGAVLRSKYEISDYLKDCTSKLSSYSVGRDTSVVPDTEIHLLYRYQT